MNALTERLLPGRLTTQPKLAADEVLEGVARHVAAEGCQFVLSTNPPSVRQPMMFRLGSGTVVSGRISWVLGDRIGFAFDHRLGPDAIAELSSLGSSLRMIQLTGPREDAVSR